MEIHVVNLIEYKYSWTYHDQINDFQKWSWPTHKRDDCSVFWCIVSQKVCDLQKFPMLVSELFKFPEQYPANAVSINSRRFSISRIFWYPHVNLHRSLGYDRVTNGILKWIINRKFRVHTSFIYIMSRPSNPAHGEIKFWFLLNQPKSDYFYNSPADSE